MKLKRNIINIATFVFCNKKYKIIASKHLLETRDNETYKRNEFYTRDNYKEIVHKALINGLLQYRNKGNTVISFLDYRKRNCSVLLKLSNNNEIFIISTFNNYVTGYNQINFIKENNRINLYQGKSKYIKEFLSKEQRNKEILNQDFLSDEDARFLYSTKGIKRI